MKYEPLAHYLRKSESERVRLTFEEVEAILGAPLPRSARKYPAWWANSAEGHVNAQAWLAAGYRAQEVDLKRQELVFEKQPEAPRGIDPKAVGFLDRLRSRLAGTATIPGGVDLTEPAGEVWDAER